MKQGKKNEEKEKQISMLSLSIRAPPTFFFFNGQNLYCSVHSSYAFELEDRGIRVKKWMKFISHVT